MFGGAVLEDDTDDDGVVEDEKIRWEVCGVGLCMCALLLREHKCRAESCDQDLKWSAAQTHSCRLKYPLTTSEMLGQAPKEPTSELLPFP